MIPEIRRKLALAINGLCIVLLGAMPASIQAQTSALYADLNSLDGQELKPENVLNYSLYNRSGSAVNVRVKGNLALKTQPIFLRYEFTKLVRPGSNPLTESDRAQIVWTSNEPALKELFLTHGRLPQGTVEYCVDLQPLGTGNEQGTPDAESSCIYHTQDDLFALNLIDPEDKATLYDRYPAFSWVANYPFASALTYRIRVAEQKPGQNPVNAMARNNAMWQDNHVAATTAMYPLTAKPLEYGQPYVWTVDAYYKGLLLGGAETWRFILAEDSLTENIPRESYYVDIREEKGGSGLYAVGKLKLKYHLREARQNNLVIRCFSEDEKEILSTSIPVQEGYNQFELDLQNVSGIKHMKKYKVTVEDQQNNTFLVEFRYVNPDFL